MREFDLGRRFDAVVIPFDTINHLPIFGDWRRVFACARRHLSPGGVLIFDANTEYKFERYIHEPTHADVADDSTAVTLVKRTGVRRYRVTIKVFQRQARSRRDGELYRLHELEVNELVVPTAKLVRELRRHFSAVRVFDPERARPTACTEELFYVCRV